MPYVSPNIQGWMDEFCLEWLYEQAQTMDSIVEIGSWKGRSTHALLSGCRGPVFAVDHFKGNPDELNGAHIEAVTGDIFAQFWANVGAFRNLVVLRMPSAEAARYFAPASVDMVFIDGCHVYNDVLADLEAWRPKCRRLMCGHDASYDSVKKALNTMGFQYEKVSNAGIWRIDIAT